MTTEIADLTDQATHIRPRGLRDEIEAHGLPLNALTVLAPQNDPFRVDTPAGHRDGAWLADQIADLGLGGRTIHLRGLHYRLVGRCTRPDGKRYINSEESWLWLQSRAAKCARYLQYVPFDMIEDQRNTPPLIIRNGLQVPEPFLDLGGVDVELPDEITDPQIHLRGIQSRQPFKLVMYGEKSSLLPELEPLAKRYSADLYVMTGEISDTLMYTMASHAAADGRPLVVLTFSDCDPAGWQMPVSIGRKLQAFKASHYPDLKFEMRRVALTPDHVRAYGLPSTPLKAGELRADKWTASYGVEQTEIDALASLQPDLLRNLAIQMLDHFFDHTLRARCNAAAARWRDEAQSQLVDLIGPERLEAFREEAQAKLESLHEEIAAINEALQIDASDLDLPEFDQPEAEIPEAPDSEPLIDSTWPFPEQCRRLKAAKGYTEGMTR